MTLIDSTPRTDIRPDVRPTLHSGLQPAPLGGSYVTTRRPSPRSHTTMGAYVTSRNPAPAAPGSYVTVATPGPVSGGSYTYTG